MTNYLSFGLLFLLFNCSFKNSPLRNQKMEGHFNLYSKPHKESTEVDPSEVRIVIAATSNLASNEFPESYNFKDKQQKEKQQISIGGIDAIEQYLKILREEYQNLILVDSGSILASNPSNIFDKLDYNAITLGVNDFNQKLSHHDSTTPKDIKKFIGKSKTPVLLSNLIDLKKGIKVEWKGSKSHLVETIEGIKIGMIGVLPDELTELTPDSNRVGLIFQDMLQTTLSEARLMRSLGADAIVVITNQSLTCGETQALKENLPLSKVNFEPRLQNVCDLSNSFGKFIQRLPNDLVDVIVTGRNKTKVANIINNTLVLGGGESPQSLIFAELFFNKETRTILKEKSLIHQPVFFCREFFKTTQDCFFEDQSINHKERSPAIFLGKEILVKNDTLTNDSSQTTIDFNRALIALQSDIIIRPKKLTSSQLKKIEIRGYELLSLLEEEYNLARKDEWIPLKFQVKNNYLEISLGGNNLDPKKTYSVLANIETILSKNQLRKHLNNQHSHFSHLAWRNFTDLSVDQISTKMSSTTELPTED